MQVPPVLFFKTFNSEGFIYEHIISNANNDAADSIAFRSFSPQDIPTIYKWVNAPYASRFWQLKGYPPEALQEMLTENMQHPFRHILIGLYNNKPVCEIDVYHIHCDELYPHIPNVSHNDCGIHFLMAPPREIFKGLSIIMLRAFMDAYFAYRFAGGLYAEPDELNTLANRFAVNAGFTFMKQVNLQHKKANLYRITKQDFQSQTPSIPHHY